MFHDFDTGSKSRNTSGTKVMRLSLRTLLAFEDNIFDSEQHRQLERIIPRHDAAAMTLGRLRRVVRDPRLGVPGQVDRREELDPNLVAGYLDHQMAADMQERFEAFCLSSDKYLAEVASIHQVLSNVLGEPARTSRECRLRCYDLYGTPVEVPTFDEKLRQFADGEYDRRERSDEAPALEPAEQSFDAFLRLFPTTGPGPDHQRASTLANRPPREPAPTVPFPIYDPPMTETRPPVREEYIPAPEKKKASPMAFLFHFFSSEEEEPARPKTRSGRGFSLWILLLVFLLGFGLLYGWRYLEGRFTEPRDIRSPKEIGGLAPPPRPSEFADIPASVVIPTTPKAAAVEKAPPVTSPSPPIVAPPVEIVVETVKPSPPPPPPPPAPEKKELPKIVSKKEVEKEPKIEPKVEQEKKEEIAETKAELPPPPLPPPPPPIVMAKNEVPPPTPPMTPPAPPSLPEVVKETKIEPPTLPKIAEKPVVGPVDPFLSVAGETAETNGDEAVKTVVWNAPEGPVAEPIKEPAVEPVLEKSREPKKIEAVVATPPTPKKLVKTEVEPDPVPANETPRLVKTAPEPVEPATLDSQNRESLIAFQPIAAPSQRRGTEGGTNEKRPDPFLKQNVPTLERPRFEPVTAAVSPIAPGKVVHPPSTARQFGDVVPVGRLSEQNDPVLGRALPLPEPHVLFSATSAGDQWSLKSLPLDLHADQYLLTVTPFRIDIELAGSLRIEMVGDTKLSILPPDKNGVPGIYVDYGRLVIRSTPNGPAVRPLRIRTDTVEGILELGNPGSVAFVDTFAEVLPESAINQGGINFSSAGLTGGVPKTSPIIGFLPAPEDQIRWLPVDRPEPMVARRQVSVLLRPGPVDFGSIHSLPNWLQRTPLPVEGRQLAEVCDRVFREHHGNTESALHALIARDSSSVRFFGYRLWGDLGRFDVPLSLLAEAKPDEQAVRQVLVPYFREVMKRDEETVQRLADAIEAVRR